MASIFCREIFAVGLEGKCIFEVFLGKFFYIMNLKRFKIFVYLFKKLSHRTVSSTSSYRNRDYKIKTK